MTPEEIKEYLGTMVEVEKECYLHERLLQTLKKRIEPLGHPKNIAKPQLKEIDPDEAKFNLQEFLFCTLSVGVIGFIVGEIIGIPIGAITPLTVGEAEKWCGAICAVLFAVFGLLFWISSRVETKKQIAQIPAENQALIQKYHQSVAADKQRVEAENRVLAYLKTEYNAALKSYNALKDTRTKLYNTNILFEKYYYNFPAVSSLYEYFSAGRYTTLGEAYNQLELEARLDRISLQLNVVIAKLEQIKENQYTIYSAITDANARLNSLIQSSSRIEAGVRNLQLQGEELNARVAGLQATSDLNLYINAMNNQELSYMRRWMAY